MAQEDHLKRAGYAVGSWNGWRDEHPDITPDLSGADLSGGLYRKGKFFEANLAGTDFRGSNMREADLHGSNLTGADLSKCDLRGANLAKTKLTEAELAKSNLVGADLSGADLSGADLEKAHVNGANLTSARLSGVKLRKTDLGLDPRAGRRGFGRFHHQAPVRLEAPSGMGWHRGGAGSLIRWAIGDSSQSSKMALPSGTFGGAAIPPSSRT